MKQILCDADHSTMDIVIKQTLYVHCNVVNIPYVFCGHHPTCNVSHCMSDDIKTTQILWDTDHSKMDIEITKTQCPL